MIGVAGTSPAMTTMEKPVDRNYFPPITANP
jgi:hypothetical protein